MPRPARKNPNNVKITFLTDPEKRDALDTLADSMDRDRSYILNEAIAAYLDVWHWQIEDLQKGIAEADAGDFATDEEVASVLNRLISE